MVLLAASCMVATEASPSGISIKSRVESSSDGATLVRAYLEGPDGNQVTGARVLVSSPEGSVSQLDFSLNRGCYFVDLDNSSSGNYLLTVDSTLLSKPRQVTIPLKTLAVAPVLAEVSDDDGSDALIGESLSTHASTTVRWSPVPDASLYVVKVSFGATVAWKRSTADPFCEIPEASISAGNYTLQVRAQYMQGDPYLVDTDTFSGSESPPTSLALVFN